MWSWGLKSGCHAWRQGPLSVGLSPWASKHLHSPDGLRMLSTCWLFTFLSLRTVFSAYWPYWLVDLGFWCLIIEVSVLGERKEHMTCARSCCFLVLPGRLLRCEPATSFVKLHLGRWVQRVKTENNGCINLKAVGQMFLWFSWLRGTYHVVNYCLSVRQIRFQLMDSQSMNQTDLHSWKCWLKIELMCSRSSQEVTGTCSSRILSQEEYIRGKYSLVPVLITAK